jgi:N-acetylglutamate synthase-like GNAT family acetyltransferase
LGRLLWKYDSGTVGLCILKNKQIELKRLFLHHESRGKGIAQDLLDTVIASAKSMDVSAIYLGTMNQFKAAQAFYGKQGFSKIPESLLPGDFIANPVDSCFYRKEF